VMRQFWAFPKKDTRYRKTNCLWQKLVPEAEKVEDDSVHNSVWQGVLLIQQDPAQNHPLQGSRAQYFLPKIRIIESVSRTLESDPLKNC
jgi:hypothetical protein